MRSLCNTTPKVGDRIKLVSYSVKLFEKYTLRKCETVKSVKTDRWGDIIITLSGGNHWITNNRGCFSYDCHTGKKSFSTRLEGGSCEVTR